MCAQQGHYSWVAGSVLKVGVRRVLDSRKSLDTYTLKLYLSLTPFCGSPVQLCFYPN